MLHNIDHNKNYNMYILRQYQSMNNLKQLLLITIIHFIIAITWMTELYLHAL